MADKHPAWDQIEPDAAPEAQTKGLWLCRPGQHDIELSKAISLKRIADALNGNVDEMGWREDQAFLLGQCFKRGMDSV